MSYSSKEVAPTPCLALLAILAFLGGVTLSGPAGGGEIIVSTKAVPGPPASTRFCLTHEWACSRESRGTLTDNRQIIAVARQVNRLVNARVRPVSDRAQYRRQDHWALPTRRGGDCEDVALLKKRMLLERGVASTSLSIATVMDRKRNPHAVLVLRTELGDLVLDNLTNEIRRWDRTGYSFLKIQDKSVSTGWTLVMQGGMFR